MTVFILTSASNQTNGQVPSLCYEVHGREDKYFNLISDTCTSVNAFYEKANVTSKNIFLNMVTKIGVRAVGRDDSSCTNIEVDLDSCTTSIDGVPLSQATYFVNGIGVRRNVNGTRVRIAVPNCADRQLVMWIFCTSGLVEDPVTWDYYRVQFIRFVVMRGLNLNEQSHGIIGMSTTKHCSITLFSPSPLFLSRSVLECASDSCGVYWSVWQ